MIEFLWMVATGATAYLSGRRVWVWVFASALLGGLGWIMPFVVMMLPKNYEKMQQREQLEKDKAEEYLTKKEFKDINTVDDLFKQLEKK